MKTVTIQQTYAGINPAVIRRFWFVPAQVRLAQGEIVNELALINALVIKVPVGALPSACQAR
ncbi:MAG: hypothetical protein R2932_16750 [Caldilineaceae bacterium]